jgi:hypothetical protein
MTLRRRIVALVLCARTRGLRRVEHLKRPAGLAHPYPGDCPRHPGPLRQPGLRGCHGREIGLGLAHTV